MRTNGINFNTYKQYSTTILKLNHTNIKKEPKISGIYILSQNKPQSYQYKESNIIYIGMSSNIKDRLRVYCNKQSHTLAMQKILYTQELNYTYIQIDYYEQFETLLLELFKEEYGER